MFSKALINEFKSGAAAPLYFLWSDEYCFLEDALLKFIEIVIADNSRDFNYEVFDSTSGPQEILDAASTLPFMAPRRLVVIKEFNQFKAPAVKVLKTYFDEPSVSTCMVVLSQKAPRATLKVKWKVFPLNIRDSDIPAWLKHTAAGKGITLADDAIDYLIEFVGYDIGLLMMEVEKLTLSGNTTISGKDIISSTSMMRKYSPFDLLDALISGERTRAFRILKTLLSGNAMEATSVLGTLNWHYKQFYTLWLNKGKKPMKMRQKTYSALKNHLHSFSEGDFFRIFESLHEADLGIKSSGRPELVIEVLLIKLLQKGALN